MATKQQIPVLVGSIVSNQECFGTLPTSDAQWVIQHTAEAIQIAVKAIRERNQPAPLITRKIPSSYIAQRGMWREIYGVYFGLKDPYLLNPTIPKEAGGFNWIIIVRKGITINMVLGVLRKKMKIHNTMIIGDDFDNCQIHNDRRSGKGNYIIQVRNGIKSDTELLKNSAEMLTLKCVPTMTFLERLLLELFYFHFTGGKHLDMNGHTICAGSRFGQNLVPCVGRGIDPDLLYISFCTSNQSSSSDGAREVHYP